MAVIDLVAKITRMENCDDDTLEFALQEMYGISYENFEQLVGELLECVLPADIDGQWRHAFVQEEEPRNGRRAWKFLVGRDGEAPNAERP